MMDMTAIQKYYDGFLPHLSRDHESPNPRHTKVLADLVPIVRIGDTVLDLCCGTGITSKAMALMGATVDAVDLSPKLIEFAKHASAHDAHRSYQGSVTYHVHDVTTLDLGKTFDVIVIADGYEHIPIDRIGMLREVIKTHSHRNTVIYINIPDARFIDYITRNKPESLQIVDNAHTMPMIAIGFGSIGFQIVKFEVYGLDMMYQYNSYVLVRRDRINDVYDAFYEGG